MIDTTTLIELLRKMGHDMRVPLNTVISTGDMLLAGAYDPLTPKQLKAVDRLQRNNHRLLAVLDDFVTYVKADAGQLEVHAQPFDPRAQLPLWCDSIRKSAEQKGLNFQITVADDVPASINADESTIKRIIQALLWNAVGFTTAGSIHVNAEWTSTKAWMITIKDTGCGVPPEEVAHIFEPFWRGSQRPQMPTANAGLGLAVAQVLSKLMGGSVTLKESNSSGSIFCLTIPIQSVKSSTSTNPA